MQENTETCGSTFKDRVLDETPKFVRKLLSTSSQKNGAESGPGVYFDEGEKEV